MEIKPHYQEKSFMKMEIHLKTHKKRLTIVQKATKIYIMMTRKIHKKIK